ncbi:dihydrofolate reductase family protein [Flindersiella endophytica]
MRKIINSTYITLDGVVENVHTWPALGSSEGAGEKVQTDLLLACDAVLMGRRTYESFAPVWQSRSGDPLSDRMNTMPKYVVSTTLQDPDWANTSVISENVVEEIGRLKEQPGQDIVQYGVGAVTQLMLEAGLLDELRLWVHPFLVRNGGPQDLLFQPGSAAVTFDFVDAKALPSGVVILTYRVA